MGIKSYLKRKVLSRLQKQIPVFINVTDDKVLAGKTALISGGTSGIGLAIAKCFLQAGAAVIVCGRKPEKIEAVVSDLKKYGNASGLQLDVSDVPAMEHSISAFLENGNTKIDILVNSAGINSEGNFGVIKEDDFDKVIDTNLKGTLFLSQVVANYMKANHIKGNILNIASTGAFRPADTAYRISKWGVRGLTLGMAKSLIPYGIVVNGIAPGPTATSMLSASNDDLTRERNPAGRMATAEEVAELAKQLVSNSGKLIVGEIISLSGGAGVITFDDIDY